MHVKTPHSKHECIICSLYFELLQDLITCDVHMHAALINEPFHHWNYTFKKKDYKQINHKNILITYCTIQSLTVSLLYGRLCKRHS